MAEIASVISVGRGSPRAAARAMPSPAPKKRYQSGPPKMQAIWSSAATTDSHPPTISQWLPGLAATSGNIMRRRLFGDFLRRYPRCGLDQPARARLIVPLDHREVGDDHRSAAHT